MLSELGREFGIGFYVTTDRKLALEQAERKVRHGSAFCINKPVVTELEFDEAAEAELKLIRLDGYSKEWLDFIMRCYTDIHFVHPYDIVIGNAVLPDIARLLSEYRKAACSEKELLEELDDREFCTQICFSTAAALDYLTSLN